MAIVSGASRGIGEAIPHFGPLLDAELWQWDKILEVNVKGYFWLCQIAARQMIAQGDGGKIINMASVAGLKPGPMMGTYSASKSRCAYAHAGAGARAGERRHSGERHRTGFVKTCFSAALWQNPLLNDRLTEDTPAGHVGEPDEITGIALYLASEASAFTTGAVFTVDGGYTLT